MFYFKEEREKKWYMGLRKKRCFILLLIPISFIIVCLVTYSSYIAEYVFARGVYGLTSSIISKVTGVLPYSLMEMTLIIIPILVMVYIIYLILGIRKRRRKRTIPYFLTVQLVNILCVVSVLLFSFIILAGTNYYRYPFSKVSGLEVKASTVTELYEVMDELSLEAKDIRIKLEEQRKIDEYGVITISDKELRELGTVIQDEFLELSKEYQVFNREYGNFKPVINSKFMSRMEITGIYWPFTVEANVNVHATDFSIPAVIAHEMAHQRGFMREDEANFIAYLVCRNSDNLLVRYSGIMLALSYGNNQLSRYNVDLYNKVVMNYNEGMILDIRDEYYYWKQFEDTVISTMSYSMNNIYLKANNQTDGVKSYGRMVDLLLAYHKK